MVLVRALALVLLVLAGCDQAFGLTEVKGDGTTPDGGLPTVDAAPRRFPNIMFVSSGKFAFPRPGLADADMSCSNAAHTAGLLGSYVAWLSSPALSIADRLRSLPFARGWRRPDGMPFADTVNDIVTGNILNPPRIDENDQDAVMAEPSIQVATGTQANGMYVPGHDATCGNGNIEIGIPASTVAGAWTDMGFLPCGSQLLRMYCFSFGAQ